MSTQPLSPPSRPETRERPRPGRAVWIAYTGLAFLLAGCVVYQVFLAGMAIFVHAGYWASHVTFVHVFELLPILLLVLAFAGRMPKGRGLYLSPIAAFFLISLQYAFAGAGRTALAALHPVNALVIFGVALRLLNRAWTEGGFRVEAASK